MVTENYINGLAVDPKTGVYLQNADLLSTYSGHQIDALKEAVKSWSVQDPHLASQLIIMPFVFQFGPFFFTRRRRFPTLGETQRCLRTSVKGYVDQEFLTSKSQAYTIRKYATRIGEWKALLHSRVGALKQAESLSEEEEALEVDQYHHYIRQKYLGDDVVEKFIKYVTSGTNNNEFITSMAYKIMHNFRNQQQ